MHACTRENTYFRWLYGSLQALVEQDYWEVFSPLPLLRLQPAPLSLLGRPERAYDCPLYCTSSRAGKLTTSGEYWLAF